MFSRSFSEDLAWAIGRSRVYNLHRTSAVELPSQREAGRTVMFCAARVELPEISQELIEKIFQKERSLIQDVSDSQEDLFRQLYKWSKVIDGKVKAQQVVATRARLSILSPVGHDNDEEHPHQGQVDERGSAQ